MEPLVSIALTTYNGSEYLSELLDSLYSQTYKNIEIVACDDCSADATVTILQEYQRKYGLSFCVNEHRLGFVKNFEKAISMCRGDYIALCDQDDIWLPEKIEILLSMMNGKPLICSDLILVTKNNEIISDSLYAHTDLRFKYTNQFKYLIYSNFVVGCSTLFKRELKQYILPFPENTKFHDWWIALVAAANGGIAFCSKPLVLYRYHGSNSSLTGKTLSSVANRIKEVTMSINSNFYIDKYRWLNNLYNHQSFTDNQKKYIIEAMAIYEGLIKKAVPLKSTWYAFKNRDFIYPRRGLIKQIVFTLGMLFLGILEKFKKDDILYYSQNTLATSDLKS